MKKLDLSSLNKNGVVGALSRGELLFERVFTPKDAGVDNRTFHVWKKKGLVDFIERGSWARVSFVGLVWLRTLECMRRFGCSVRLMKQMHDFYFTSAYHDNLAEDVIKTNLMHYQSLVNAGHADLETEMYLQRIQQIAKDELLKHYLRGEITYFSELVKHCMTYRKEAVIIIYEDGRFEDQIVSIEKPIDQNKSLVAQLRIPLSGFITEYITDENKLEFLHQASVFSDNEYKVIREMRNKNAASITIRFNEENHNIEYIESDQKGFISGDKAKKVMNLLGLKNYSSIELKTRSGESFSFHSRERIQIK